MMDLTFPYTVVTLCGRPGSLNAELSEIRFNLLRNVCVDALNNIYLCENLGGRISKIDSKRETIVIFFDNSMVDFFVGSGLCFLRFAGNNSTGGSSSPSIANSFLRRIQSFHTSTERSKLFKLSRCLLSVTAA